ncbi:GIY-YIG nuclease family protein [Nostoc punctiforme FACHB-252]|uniref:GIY-YIG nuclease family protein n=1 Tax=Nostoc punctiforme FACHB-252 TaxID=1357509 RepID=A0ABR8HKZ3_NOSPU|nr:GIY-YIG nuclease family protein [Nostoc punctiforme]MBD2616519.1 GIY-YIG nuclease family protein [Nostoc punctiforme FACHB-252]
MLQNFNNLPSLNLIDKQKLPKYSGIYFAVASGQVLYVGQAVNLRNRWQNHHRLPQLEAINCRCQVKLFWINCLSTELNDLERQYIQFYCPTLNQTKVPQKKLLPSFQMLTLSLKKLNERVLVFGVCPVSEKLPLKTIVIGYLANYTETRLATTLVRKSLQAINRKPNSLFRWIEYDRLRNAARWLTRCNGIETRLIPCFEERIMHNPSMYRVMEEKRFGVGNSIALNEYEAMRQEVKAMSFSKRLELARNSEIGRQLFPLECGSQLRVVSGVEILCLTSEQLKVLLNKKPYIQEQHPGICAINEDPVPKLLF